MSNSSRRVTFTQRVKEAMGIGPVLIATDFDGTIAPLAEHPDDAVADERALAALTALAAMPRVQVAVVSGRPHADLVRVTSPDAGLILVGEHGNDVGDDQGQSARIDSLISQMREVAEALPGSYVEVKRNSVGFHWRQAEGDPTSAIERIEAVADGIADLSLLRGKKIIELSFGQRTKADAVLELSVDRDATVFLGDDITDEDVFEALGPDGLTVKVGEGPTSANHRVASVEEVVELLEALADQSDSHASTSITSADEVSEMKDIT